MGIIWRSLTCVGFFVLLLLSSDASAQQKYKVGDKVRFEHMRNEVEGSITEILRTGWYRVEYDGKFGKQFKILPPAKVLGGVDAQPANPNNSMPTEPSPAAGGSPATVLRIWTDNTGKHKMEGQFVDLVDGIVTLKKSDGEPLTLPLDRLSDADVALAKSLKAGLSDDSENPFAGGTMATDPFAGGTTDSSSETTESFAVTKIDFSNFKKFAVGSASKWDVQPIAPSPISITNKWTEVDVSRLDNMQTDFRNPTLVYFGDRDMRAGTETGFVVDLTSGEKIGPISIPMINVNVVAFDAVDNRLMTATTMRERSRDKTVDIWKIEPDASLIHQIGFVPSDQRNTTPVRLGKFLDDDRVMVGAKQGSMGVINLDTRQADSLIEFTLASEVKFSDDGRYLHAFIDPQYSKYSVFDLHTMETVGTLDLNLGMKGEVGFNDSMTRAAVAIGPRLKIWDTTVNKLSMQLVLPIGMTVSTRPQFIDDDNLLLSRSTGASLINLPLMSPIWNYQIAFEKIPGSQQGGKAQFVTRSRAAKKSDVGITQLPHPAAAEIINRLTPEDVIVMRPGDSCSFAGRQGRPNITGQLEKYGYKIDKDSPLQFRSSVVQGKPSTQTYRDVTGGADQTVTTQSLTVELALYLHDEKVWYRRQSSGGDNMGSFVQLEQGETLQSRANKGKGSAEQFFNGLQLPEVFVRTPESYFYGHSASVGENGFSERPAMRR